MTTLKKREKVLMSLTLVAMLGAVVYSFGLGDYLDQFTSQTDRLESGQKNYVEAIATLQEEGEIEQRYQGIESQVPAAAGGKRLDMVFTEEIVAICRSLGISVPQLDPAEYEDIEGVEDFQFITARLRTEGNLDTVVKLLKAFQTRGLLFREVDLQNVQDQDVIRARVVLARMAPVPENLIKARQRERSTRKTTRAGATDEF